MFASAARITFGQQRNLNVYHSIWALSHAINHWSVATIWVFIVIQQARLLVYAIRRIIGILL